MIGKELTAGERLRSLDGWRAIAIALVILSHFQYSSNVPHIPPALGWHGDLGVRIFFVLSGFLITRLLLVEHERTGSISLRDFYIRRALRILPVYYLYLACLGILSFAGLYSDTLSSWIGALTFTRNMFGRGDSATVHLWSLAVEEQFYLAWPMLLVLLKLYQRRALALGLLFGIMIAAFMARNFECLSDGIFCRRIMNVHSAVMYADSLAAGCAAAIIRKHWPVVISPWILTVLLRASLLLLVGLTVIELRGDANHSLVVLLQAVSIAMAIVCSVEVDKGLFVRMLNTRGAIALGLLSYSLYVWHVMFLSAFMPAFESNPLYDWKVWWLVATIVAALSYYFYERPILALRNRFRPRPGKALSALAG